MATLATETLTLPILGMTCASCQHHVEEALNATPGVESAHVDLIAQRASVVFDPSLTGAGQLVDAVRASGYDAVLPRTGGPAADAAPNASQSTSRAEIKAYATLGAGAVAMLLAMPLGPEMGAADHVLMRVLPWLYALPPELLRWFLLAMTAVLMVWAGRGIYLSAARSLRHGTTNMNTLVSLGTGAAFVYSAFATLWPAPDRQVYFDAVLLILGFLLFGKSLEAAPSAAPWPRWTRFRGCARRPPAASGTAWKPWCLWKKLSPATACLCCPASGFRWTRPFWRDAPVWTNPC